MTIIKNSLLALCLVASLFSCNNDDDNNNASFPMLSREESEANDRATIETYLRRHYFNSAQLDSLQNPTASDIVIEQLQLGVNEAPAGHTILVESQLLEKRETVFEDTNYEYYVLTLRKGEGQAPNLTDNLRMKLEGFTINNSEEFVFATTANSLILDLASDLSFVGWRLVAPTFNTAASFTEQENGELTFNGAGTGVMFLPSGLAFFSESVNNLREPLDNNNNNQQQQTPNQNVTRFTPVAFKFDILQSFVNDHDMDGIPSHVEDNSPALNLDTDGDLTVNYRDNDDDGDGIPTINEDIDNDGNPANDIGRNNIPRYLDPEEVEFVN